LGEERKGEREKSSQKREEGTKGESQKLLKEATKQGEEKGNKDSREHCIPLSRTTFCVGG
jgi:hypothetical protein